MALCTNYQCANLHRWCTNRCNQPLVLTICLPWYWRRSIIFSPWTFFSNHFLGKKSFLVHEPFFRAHLIFRLQHIACTYRQQYFESILAKPVSFFDEEENSSGTLTARVANDPTQLQQLLGINMGMVYVAVFSLVGCIIISFYFGWKFVTLLPFLSTNPTNKNSRLTLVATLVSMPIILACAFFRLRYELQFEAMNNAVFAESSKFASESIGAFRTVTSLTLEDMISKRYGILLQDHVDKAFKKAGWTTLVFSASDSVSLLCMALTFWYGVCITPPFPHPLLFPSKSLTNLDGQLGQITSYTRIRTCPILRRLHRYRQRIRIFGFPPLFWTEYGAGCGGGESDSQF